MSKGSTHEVIVDSANNERKEIDSTISNKRLRRLKESLYLENGEIKFYTLFSSEPWEDTNVVELSQLYPTVIFQVATVSEYTGELGSPSAWFCNGIKKRKTEVERIRKQAYKTEVQRSLASTGLASDGIAHRVELMPDGRVAADGENRFGECNILFWDNIKQISCGNWHTVGLKNDGTLVACGSNANGQCEVYDIEERATDISCGRYHTAILLESGRVVVRGNFQDIYKHAKASRFMSDDFPMIAMLVIDKSAKDIQKMNELIEQLDVGDELILRKVAKDSSGRFDVLNMKKKKIGILDIDYNTNANLARLINNVKASVHKITPLSLGSICPRYLAVTVKLEYISLEKDKGEMACESLNYHYNINISDWPKVSRIKSIYDAVIGVTDEGKMLAYGICPCSKDELKTIMGLS